METISLYETITESGLTLDATELKMFLNQRVKIVISSLDENEARKERLRQLAGCLDDEDAKIFEEALAECRQVNNEAWK